MKYLGFVWKGLKALLAVIPLVKALVETAEGPSFGEDKKTAVMGALRQALIALGIDGKALELALIFADGFIDTLVWLKNLWGEFKHQEEPEGAG